MFDEVEFQFLIGNLITIKLYKNRIYGYRFQSLIGNLITEMELVCEKVIGNGVSIPYR